MFSTVPSYSYSNHIKSPSDMGMGTNGSWDTIRRNLKGLMEYKDALMVGNSNATTQPYLGDRYFLNTGLKCTDNNGIEQERYTYVNNMVSKKSSFRGLVPATLYKLTETLNPTDMLNALTSSSSPTCMPVTLQVKNDIDMNDNRTENHYVATMDIQNIDECVFSDGINPVTKQKCKDGFNNLSPHSLDDFNDVYDNLFYVSFGILILYIFYKKYNN